jgi:hypothetical protein
VLGGLDAWGSEVTAAVLPHVAFAREVLASETAGLPYPFVRRAQVAALPAVPVQNSIEAPAYLMDLGLRHWRDPRVLFTQTLARQPELSRAWSRLEPRQADALVMIARHWEAGDMTDAELTAHLETLVIFTGDDDGASSLSQMIAASVRPIDTPRLAVAVGTQLSGTDPVRGEHMLNRALDVTMDPVAAFLIGLRLVALQIKRLRDHKDALDLISMLWAEADSQVHDFIVSEADGRAMRALLLNLRALVEVQRGEMFDAVETMTRAAATMPDDGFVQVPTDMANRYRAQVRINVTQALWLAGRETEAIQRINAHVAQTRMEHPYSLSEALLVAAYFNEIAGTPAQVLSYCLEAERLLIKEGAPTRLAMCRRIAVAALAAAGKTGRAEKLARALVRDPLGGRFLV